MCTGGKRRAGVGVGVVGGVGGGVGVGVGVGVDVGVGVGVGGALQVAGTDGGSGGAAGEAAAGVVDGGGEMSHSKKEGVRQHGASARGEASACCAKLTCLRDGAGDG